MLEAVFAAYETVICVKEDDCDRLDETVQIVPAQRVTLHLALPDSELLTRAKAFTVYGLAGQMGIVCFRVEVVPDCWIVHSLERKLVARREPENGITYQA